MLLGYRDYIRGKEINGREKRDADGGKENKKPIGIYIRNRFLFLSERYAKQEILLLSIQTKFVVQHGKPCVTISDKTYFLRKSDRYSPSRFTCVKLGVNLVSSSR